MKHTLKSLREVAALSCITFALTHQINGAVIADTFEINSQSSYTVVNDGTPNGTQTFAFDYLAAGIPLAPRSAPGAGKGLRLTANDSASQVDSWTVFHTTSVIAQRYRFEVDVFWNIGTVATATTEFAQIGVGGDGSTFNSIFTPISGSGSFIAFTGDGGSASDYRWHLGAANGGTGTLPNTDPSYLGNGSNNTNSFFQGLFPLNSRPVPAVAGSPGNMWTTVSIDVDNDNKTITYSFDGTKTFEGSFTGDMKGSISLGINDPFTSVDSGNVFVVYDNLNVTVIPEPSSALLLVLGALGFATRRRRR